jgi:uncharacterized protein YicC (UPF0701 family)
VIEMAYSPGKNQLYAAFRNAGGTFDDGVVNEDGAKHLVDLLSKSLNSDSDFKTDILAIKTRALNDLVSQNPELEGDKLNESLSEKLTKHYEICAHLRLESPKYTNEQLKENKQAIKDLVGEAYADALCEGLSNHASSRVRTMLLSIKNGHEEPNKAGGVPSR